MNWYYAAGGEQRGPVATAELADLARQGIVTGNTLVWREGLAGWEPFSVHRATVAPELPAGDDTAPGMPSGSGTDGRQEPVRCSVCGGTFAPDDTIVLAGHRTCAACKPVLIRRIEQGATGTAIGGEASASQVTEEELAGRDYSIDATGLVGEAWNLVFKEPGILLLGPLLATLAYYALVAVTSVLNLVPIAGAMVSGVLINLAMGPFLAGSYHLFLTRLRGRPADIGLVFAGCTRRVRDLLLVRGYLSLFTVALNLVILLALGSAFLGGFRFTPGAAGPQLPSLTAALAGGSAYLLVLLGYMYFAVCWVWSVPLVFEKGYGWREALRLSRRVVTRHWWQHLWLMFLSGLLVTAGMLVCCVGALVAIPVVLGMFALQFRRLFEDLRPAKDPA